MKSTLLLLLALPALALAQGSLTPPGAPAPTMRSLGQIEPRHPLGLPRQLNTTTLVITAPGSYVLMGNLTVAGGDAIRIRANDVTLDLNGFTITSLAATAEGCGIRLGGTGFTAHRARIRNGLIYCAYGITSTIDPIFTGGGFLHGIAPDHSNACSGVQLEGLVCTGGGNAPTPGHGIDAGPDSLVTDCVVRAYVGDGIRATTVRDSLAYWNGGAGIRATTVSRCASESFGFAPAIAATTVDTSSGICSHDDGIAATGTVTASYGNSWADGFAGIRARNAVRSFGASANAAVGLQISETATFCVGDGLNAETTIGCALGMGTLTSTNKYLMPGAAP